MGCRLGSLTLSTHQPPLPERSTVGVAGSPPPSAHLPVQPLMEPRVALFAGDGTQTLTHASHAL